jgi:hypothetical protein
MMTADDADTLIEVFEIVQHVRLRHELEHLGAGETPSDTMRLRAMSAIEANVLDEAIREILAIQRRIANRRSTSRTSKAHLWPDTATRDPEHHEIRQTSPHCTRRTWPVSAPSMNRT